MCGVNRSCRNEIRAGISDLQEAWEPLVLCISSCSSRMLFVSSSGGDWGKKETYNVSGEGRVNFQRVAMIARYS
jgi:hypothetical protein